MTMINDYDADGGSLGPEFDDGGSLDFELGGKESLVVGKFCRYCV